MIILPETRDSMFFLRQILSLQEFLEITNCTKKSNTEKNTTGKPNRLYIQYHYFEWNCQTNMPDCIPVYMQTQYFHRKGRDPFVSSGTSGNPYPAKTKICPLNSLNMLQKNNLKSASIFCSNSLLPLVFFHFSYSSILVPALPHPASHCFPLLLFPSLLLSSSFFFSL